MNPPDEIAETGEIADLVRPLSARSLLASALLGTHPPRLAGRHLVAMAERFGIAAGTARVALSRMVERGELVNDNGTYALAGDLLARQARQDRSRNLHDAEWDGSWELVLVTATGRSSSERSNLRRHLDALGLGERREGAWMRPDNLSADRQPATWQAIDDRVERYTVAPVPTDRARALAGDLFDLPAWGTTARAVTERLADAQRGLADDPDAVVRGFMLASAALRHLSHDPQLPRELEPEAWPATALRVGYRDFERAYQAELRAFFRSVD